MAGQAMLTRGTGWARAGWVRAAGDELLMLDICAAGGDLDRLVIAGLASRDSEVYLAQADRSVTDCD
jgi:hypothetical protein